MLNIEERHEKYREKITGFTYSILEHLFYVSTDTEYKKMDVDRINTLMENNREKFYRVMDTYEKSIKNNEDRLRAYVMYTRYCNIIDFCIEMSNSRDEIDYYLFDNSLNELNVIGISFYIDVSLRRHKSYLYRCEGGDSTWNWNGNSTEQKPILEHIKNSDNVTKDDIMKLMVYLAVAQIKKDFGNLKNRNQITRLRSYSKCLGRDLFRYCSEPSSGKPLLIHINKDADINVVSYKQNNEKEEVISLQEFLWKRDISMDKILSEEVSDINFSISTCDVRGYKNDNLIKWITGYLPLKPTKKWLKQFYEKIEVDDTYLDKNNLTKDIIGTIADKEIVFSKHAKECDDIKYEFNKEEFYLLLFMYHIVYITYLTRDECKDILQCTKNNIKIFMKNVESSFESTRRDYCEDYSCKMKKTCNISAQNTFGIENWYCERSSFLSEMKELYQYWHKLKANLSYIIDNDANFIINGQMVDVANYFENNKDSIKKRGTKVNSIEYIKEMLNEHVDWNKEIAYMKEINSEMEQAGNNRVGYTYMYKEESNVAKIWKLCLWNAAVNKNSKSFYEEVYKNKR